MDFGGGGAEQVMLALTYSFIRQCIDVELVLINLESPYLAQLPPKLRVIHLEGKNC